MKKEIKSRADEIAKQNGYDSAYYIGQENGLDVWLGQAVHNGEPAVLGLPLWITIDSEGNENFGVGFEYMHLVKE